MTSNIVLTITVFLQLMLANEFDLDFYRFEWHFQLIAAHKFKLHHLQLKIVAFIHSFLQCTTIKAKFEGIRY